MARRLHPDRGQDSDEPAMARLNEAWYVLRDPARRSVYDAGLRIAERPSDPAPSVDDLDADLDDPVGDVVPAHARRAMLALPWLVILVVLAVIFVFTAYATSRKGGPGSVVDGLLQPGSCVRVDGRYAREVGCDGDHDGVVDSLPPIGATCRSGMTAFEDPRASSTVCVRLV